MLDTVLIYNGHPSPSAINQLELPQRSDQAQQQQSPNSLDITAVMLDSTVALEVSDQLHPGWHILLQHPAITKQQLLVCQLLCVSGSMRSALHEAAAGQVLCRIIGSNDKAPYVPWGYWEAQGATAALLASTAAVLPVSETTAESFRAWLVQHARLLHTLDLGCKPETPEATAVTAAAGRGLLGAAAGADQPLLLQGYRGCWDDTLLQHLPAATLTYLSITDDNGQSEQMWKEYAALGGNFGPVCGSNQALLKRFSKLRHLGVVEHPDLDTRNVSALLPALGVMMQLTCLMLSAGRGMEQHFQHLPVSLVEMCLGGPEDDRPDASLQSGECWEDCCKRLFKPINFSHITSLTSLLLYHDVWAFRVRQGDVLPPNVLKLSAGFAQSWEPVLQLSHLQKLYAVAAPREVLNCMPTRLSSLQAFHETWAGWQQWSVEDIEMLAKLPTRELSCTRLSAPALLQLSRLTGLTSMEIGLSDAAVWQQLPAPLGRLTQLVKVSVSGPDWEHEEQGNALTSLSGSLPVATALAALPALRSVDLHCLCFSCEAVVALAAATALTSLMLTRAGLQDSGVITLVTNMPLLQVLSFDMCSNVSDAVMPVVARHLPGLRECNFACTAVTALGIGHLTGLRQLQQVAGDDLAGAEGLFGRHVSFDGGYEA